MQLILWCVFITDPNDKSTKWYSIQPQKTAIYKVVDAIPERETITEAKDHQNRLNSDSPVHSERERRGRGDKIKIIIITGYRIKKGLPTNFDATAGGKLGEREVEKRERGETTERGLSCEPPCNMSNDSVGVGGLQPFWNFNGECKAQLIS